MEGIAGANGKRFYFVDFMGKLPDPPHPFCCEHRAFPCKECGTAHFKGCDCGFCDPSLSAGMIVRPSLTKLCAEAK